ncbi:MAG: ADP-glyceromanno-heptose 6-epimerase [Bacteroidota bacterium]|nr:ADP-glyceromanno-heptose 6-epimerase [Bacteroidota bacterium]MDP4191491.1 ADP-glyceromanno-heptose 6-epimerase [Bacteroidota bacterium]MDP4194890.1 ADP-glyceromanno-heptose 6-epimerase [Bacteroidota bacterium]
MIVVTGGAGFIGSAVVWKLNQMGEENITIVDSLGTGEKWKNLVGLKYADIYHKTDFLNRILEDNLPFVVDAIVHMGACSATTEKDADYLLNNNFKYTVELAKYCLPRRARFIYASSAATYGSGEAGYDDNVDELMKLHPLNMYGYSKHMFDLWASKMDILDKIVGLKFFNVYGPNEYHKADMRSVVHKAFHQIKDSGKVKLFKSYKKEYKDGEQKRDFIYVKDVVDMIMYFLENKDKNGLFNLGTGNSRTWNDLAGAIFSAMNKPVKIEYTDMPETLKDKYQYYTQANNAKLCAAGYTKPITSLEDGVKDYVENYLMKDKHLGTL